MAVHKMQDIVEQKYKTFRNLGDLYSLKQEKGFPKFCLEVNIDGLLGSISMHFELLRTPSGFRLCF